MKKKISVLLVAALLAGSMGGCGKNETAQASKPQESSVTETGGAVEETTSPAEEKETQTDVKETQVDSSNTGSWSGPSMIPEGADYKPLEVKANAPEYSVAADLSNIANMDQFSTLSAQQREMIAKNGFVVVPTDSEQLFYLYEENTYKMIPNFVTTDSVLQLYHIYYDYMLRNVEQNSFYEKTISMNQLMMTALLEQYAQCSKEEVKQELAKAVAYFAVADALLGQPENPGLDSVIKKYVDAELKYINAASSVEISPLAGAYVDYSLFTVRGHYTRSEELEKYFKAFSWYGVMPMPLEKDQEILDALIIADTLASNDEARAIWEDIYAVTSFMVGASDDITPIELSQKVQEVYGEIPTPDALLEKLPEMKQAITELRNPKIVNKRINKDEEQKRELRFMGQRYLIDSDILQQLCDEWDRPMPSGLDVLAVFGSEQAEKLLDEYYKPKTLWAKYEENFKIVSDACRNQTVKERTSNVYNGWLYAMDALTIPKTEGYPMFMQTDAWKNKSINSALASWAELRHDTILYGKQSSAECGGGSEPPEVIAYVEPDPEFFHRLYWLTETTYNGLMERGILDSTLQYKTETMLDELSFLEACAAKELNGEDLSAEECLTLLTYGGTLEHISASIAEASGWYQVENETDRHMALIADVHRAYGNYLEEAVGCANAIYVAVYQRGQIYLTRGAVFDYYEFSSKERLTDEQWQSQLKSGNATGRVPYSNTFLSPEKETELAIPAQPYSTGC